MEAGVLLLKHFMNTHVPGDLALGSGLVEWWELPGVDAHLATAAWSSWLWVDHLHLGAV